MSVNCGSFTRQAGGKLWDYKSLELCRIKCGISFYQQLVETNYQ